MPYGTFYFVKKQYGTTLIELLLSLMLSILLLGLLSVIYLATDRQNTALVTLNILHEHAHFALQQLKTEIEMAGFIGCPRFHSQFPFNNSTEYFLQANSILELKEDENHSSLITLV